MKWTSMTTVTTGLLLGGLLLVGVCVSPTTRLDAAGNLLDTAALGRTWGGEKKCWKKGTEDCDKTTPSCAFTCDAPKKEGDACGGNSFTQVNPTYRKAEKADEGKKNEHTVGVTSKHCGNRLYCGPACTNTILFGMICPTSQLPIYKRETEPDPDSGDCNDDSGSTPGTTTGQLRFGTSPLMADGLAGSGGRFNAFLVR